MISLVLCDIVTLSAEPLLVGIPSPKLPAAF